MIISTLTIFSYPNSTDINNELIEYLFKNNDIKINNITLELKSLCQMENNIFGLILTGIKIIKINKNSEYLSFSNGTEITKDMLLNLGEILKLNINKNKNIYNTFSYSIEYACQATEPKFEEYNKYTIELNDTGNEKPFFESQNNSYTGRYSYYNFSLKETLTDVCDNTKCELCYNTSKNQCITCKFDFTISDNNKICIEPVSTIIKTTILDKIDTTILKKIESTNLHIIQTTFPNIKKLFFNLQPQKLF